MVSSMDVAGIRPARLPGDKPAILSFINGMQHFERELEADRRVDDTVAEDFFSEITRRVETKSGAMLIAEEGGKPIGWAVVYREQNEVFVLEEERSFAYLSELYVCESARGKGIGRLL